MKKLMTLIALISLNSCVSRSENNLLVSECSSYCKSENKGKCLYIVTAFPQPGYMILLAEPKNWCEKDEGDRQSLNAVLRKLERESRRQWDEL